MRKGMRVLPLLVGILSACGQPAAEPAPAAQEPGTRSATPSVAPASSLATLNLSDPSLEDRARWWRAVQWPQDCEGFGMFPDGSAGLVFHRLADGRVLLEARCSPGSYQSSQVFAMLEIAAGRSRVLEFPGFVSPDEGKLEPQQQLEVAGTVQVDTATSAITFVNLYRATADCGTWTRYDLRGDSPPRLIEARARATCDGAPPVAPSTWPRVTN